MRSKGYGTVVVRIVGLYVYPWGRAQLFGSRSVVAEAVKVFPPESPCHKLIGLVHKPFRQRSNKS